MVSIVLSLLHFGFLGISFILPRKLLLIGANICAWLLCLFPIHPIDRNIRVLNRFSRDQSRPTMAPLTIKQKNLYYLFKNLIDFYQFLVLKRSGWQQIVECDGVENLTQVYESGKGVIGICAHLGNWELGGLVLGQYGIQTSSLIFEQLNSTLDGYVNRAREDSGVKLLHQRRGLRTALKSLEEGELITLLIDQDGTRNGYFQDFFGLYCSFPRSIELFLNHTEAALVPMVLLHSSKSDGYQLKVMPRLPLDIKAIREDYASLYGTIRDWFESIILENPEQWLLVYDRFKLRHIPMLREQGIFDQIQVNYERAWRG